MVKLRVKPLVVTINVSVYIELLISLLIQKKHKIIYIITYLCYRIDNILLFIYFIYHFVYLKHYKLQISYHA